MAVGTSISLLIGLVLAVVLLLSYSGQISALVGEGVHQDELDIVLDRVRFGVRDAYRSGATQDAPQRAIVRPPQGSFVMFISNPGDGKFQMPPGLEDKREYIYNPPTGDPPGFGCTDTCLCTGWMYGEGYQATVTHLEECINIREFTAEQVTQIMGSRPDPAKPNTPFHNPAGWGDKKRYPAHPLCSDMTWILPFCEARPDLTYRTGVWELNFSRATSSAVYIQPGIQFCDCDVDGAGRCKDNDGDGAWEELELCVDAANCLEWVTAIPDCTRYALEDCQDVRDGAGCECGSYIGDGGTTGKSCTKGGELCPLYCDHCQGERAMGDTWCGGSESEYIYTCLEGGTIGETNCKETYGDGYMCVFWKIVDGRYIHQCTDKTIS